MDALAARLDLALSYSTFQHELEDKCSDPHLAASQQPPELPRPPLLPLEQARAIRKACLQAASYVAHTRRGDVKDAPLAALEQAKQDIAGSIGGEQLAETVKQLGLAASWREVYQLEEATDQVSAAASELTGRLQRLQELVGEPVSALVGVMASEASRYTLSRLAGDQPGEARQALVAMVRAYHQLSTWSRPKWVGVNLGGWLLLEYGPATPLYQTQGADDNGEWCFAEELKEKGVGAEEVFAEHRARHVTMTELRTIASLGLNAIRVPFGYWVVTGPTCGDPYVGPCLEELDRVVAMAGELGLAVILDLHGNPGGETENKCCGRDKPDFQFTDWRRDEALHVLGVIARRFADAEAVVGVQVLFSRSLFHAFVGPLRARLPAHVHFGSRHWQVCNEPSKRIAPRDLVEHYVAAARAVREGGMPADRVSVICPLYYDEGDDKDEFYRCWLDAFLALDNCVLDFHPYFFGDWGALRPKLHARGDNPPEVGQHGEPRGPAGGSFLSPAGWRILTGGDGSGAPMQGSDPLNDSPPPTAAVRPPPTRRSQLSQRGSAHEAARGAGARVCRALPGVDGRRVECGAPT